MCNKHVTIIFEYGILVQFYFRIPQNILHIFFIATIIHDLSLHRLTRENENKMSCMNKDKHLDYMYTESTFIISRSLFSLLLCILFIRLNVL